MVEFGNESLKGIVKGTLAASIGLFVSLALTFLSRIIVARYVAVSEYGLFSLALTMSEILALISTFGLQQGAPRYIAYFRAKDERSKVNNIIVLSVQFVLIISIPLSLLVFLAAGPIATNFFHNPELIFPLKMFALGVPFLALIRVTTSIYRGFDRIDVKIYFDDLSRSVLFPLLLAIVIVCGLSFRGIIYAYPLSLAITLIALVIYSIRKTPWHLGSLKLKGENPAPLRKELFFFCLPLLGALILATIRSYSSMILLGYFKTPLLVGLYGAASPLAEFMLATSTAMSLIYVPITSGLYAKGLMAELRRNYTILVKWMVAVSLPLFLVLVLFPETVLNFVFGATYIPAAAALRILSLGFFIANLLGLASFSLLIIGRPRLMMWALLAAAGVGVVLGITLIPPLGLVGAAIAGAISVVVAEIICSVQFYMLTKAQPLSKNLLKPIAVSLALVAIIYLVTTSFFNITFWMLPILFIVFYLVYAVAMLLTRSFDQEDIAMLLEIEKMLRIDATVVKKVIRRFL